VVPGAAAAADLDPGDADRFELARALDAAQVDDVRPAEIGEQIGDGALGVGVVSGDQHRRPTLAEAGIDEIRVADDVERLHDLRFGKRALDALAERVLAADRELGREAARKVERVHRVDHHLAGEALRPGVGDYLLGGVAQDREDHELAHRGRLCERARVDARAFAGEPFAQLGLVGVARPDPHLVAASAEPRCQALPDHACSQHADLRHHRKSSG